MLTGLWSPLGRLIAAIPKPIASAMLAGILLKLCLAPFMAIGKVPWLAAAVLAPGSDSSCGARLCGARGRTVALAGMAFDRPFAGIAAADLMPRLEFVMPVFTFEAMVNIALPLFIVTMAGQNLPGLAVLAAYDYRPRVAPLFCRPGRLRSLARRSACRRSISRRSPPRWRRADAHADPARRYVAGIFGGVGYMLSRRSPASRRCWWRARRRC